MNKSENAYKVIIAIKCVKELNLTRVPTVRCCVTIADKQKTATLPFSEGQFFDLRDIDVSQPLTLTFILDKTNKEIGKTLVIIPEDVKIKDEVELADEFQFQFQDVPNLLLP